MLLLVVSLHWGRQANAALVYHQVAAHKYYFSPYFRKSLSFSWGAAVPIAILWAGSRLHLNFILKLRRPERVVGLKEQSAQLCLHSNYLAHAGFSGYP